MRGVVGVGVLGCFACFISCVACWGVIMPFCRALIMAVHFCFVVPVVALLSMCLVYHCVGFVFFVWGGCCGLVVGFG